jgi:hypothetical protein
MASLFPTKYANNIRKVSGLGVFVFQDDVTLNCNTSLGAVSINLLEIPADFWSTTYKLYVNDADNNASVNNITINAPAGYTINNAASIVINTNGGGVLIRVTNNTTYMATANSTGGGGGGYNTIQDEGVALPQRTIMNFIGAGVTASDVGGKTQVDITGGIIDITNAAMLALIAANTVIKGQYYRITDVINADLGVVVQGVTPYNISVFSTGGISAFGTGIFLNADYQGVGIYSLVPGFVANIGIWDNTPRAVVVGDVVVFDNRHYINLTGAWGVKPNTDLTNWSLLAKTESRGYILACDLVRYDITQNRVVYRADKLKNEVDYFDDGKGNEAIRDFQWGRNAVTANKVLANGIMLCTNSSSIFTANVVYSSVLAEVGSFGSGSTVISNVVQNNSLLQILTSQGNVKYNIIESESQINVTTLQSKANLVANTISSDSIIDIDTIVTNIGVNYNVISGSSKFKATGATVNANILRNIITKNSTLEVSSVALGCPISNCEVSAGTINLGAVITAKSNFSFREGYSNWEADLDFATAFAAGTLTIPTTLAYVGKFNTINTSTPTITDIVNLPTNHPVELIPALGNDFTLQYTAVALVSGNEIIRAFAAVSDTFTGSSFDRSEFVVLSSNGGVNKVLSKYIWQ